VADAVYAANLDIPAAVPIYGPERVPALRARRSSIEDFCDRAGVRYRVTGGNSSSVALWDHAYHGIVVDESGERIYLVARAGLPQRNPERSLRVLEVLAYGFNDYFARQTVCNRGYFVWPVGPEHGRAWLAEIGRKGGRRTSRSKSRASRRNGAAAIKTRRDRVGSNVTTHKQRL
jgi:hypothetical protein